MNCENTIICPARPLEGNRINTPGIYRIDGKSAQDIVISAGISVHIFDATSTVVDFSRRFILEKDAELVLCGYVYNAEYSVEVISAGSGVRSNIAYLLMSQDDKKVKAKIISRASFPHVCTEVSLVSFVGKNGNISVDGIVEVAPNCPKSRVYLREDNIFLDTTGVIRSVPSLLILSADVQAGHAARVERVSEEKLFYLLSRGVDKKNATTLLLESMVGSLFGRMKHISETLYEDVKLDILMGVSSSHRSEE